MNDVKVTQADRDAAWIFADFGHLPDSQERERWIYGYYDEQPVGHPIKAFARSRIEAQRPLLEALEKAEKTFRWYGDLHAAKPDAEKAARNYELADEMGAAIKQAKGE